MPINVAVDQRFIIKNGLVVNTNLIYTNGSNIGVLTTNPTFNLDIAGTLRATGNAMFSGANTDISGCLTVNTIASANVIGNLRVGGDLVVVGSLAISNTYAGDFTPASNSYNLGNTTNRWALWSLRGNFSNGIVVAGSNSVFNTNLLYLDTTNSRVGVGTSTPDALLTVAGSANIGGAVFINGSTTLAANISVNGVVSVGNSTVNATINSTAFTGSANNATNLGGVGAASYALLSANNTFAGANNGFSGVITQGNTVLGSLTYSSSNTSSQAIDSFAVTLYRGAKYDVAITSGSAYELTTVSVLHDGTTAYMGEYGAISTGAALATFDVSVASGNLNLTVTPTNAVTTFKVHRTSFFV